MQTYGGNVRYATPGLCIGLTALSYSFGNYSIQPDPKPYNLFYFRGNRNLNISVDYLLKNKLIKFYGETALSRNGAVRDAMDALCPLEVVRVCGCIPVSLAEIWSGCAVDGKGIYAST